MILLQTEIQNIVQKFADLLDSIYLSCQNSIGTVASISSILCATFAVFYIANMIWSSWCQGNSINLYATLKPFCIGFIIVNFSLFVSTIDNVMDLLNKPTIVLVEKSSQTADPKLKAALTSIKEVNTFEENQEDLTNKMESESDTSFLGRIISTTSDLLLDFLMWALDSVSDKIIRFLMLALTTASGIVSIALMGIAMFTKLLLYYIGPFIFALSLLPYFSNSMKAWMGKYISVCLYAPCINILNFIMMNFYNAYLENATTNTSDSVMTEDDWVFFIAISLMSIVGYLNIPAICSHIVNSMGGGSPAAEDVQRLGTGTAIKAATNGLSISNGGPIANITSAKNLFK